MAQVIIACVGVGTFIVGAFTLLKAIVEYKRQTTLKRFEVFQSMNKRFDEDEFMKLRGLLDIDSDNLAKADFTTKHNFLGFFEEIAIAINSKIMSEEVAFYLFGYYAIKCWKSGNFWSGERMIGKDSVYWALFRQFAQRMEALETRLSSQKIDPAQMRF